jgi:hypothetical protein
MYRGQLTSEKGARAVSSSTRVTEVWYKCTMVYSSIFTNGGNMPRKVSKDQVTIQGVLITNFS